MKNNGPPCPNYLNPPPIPSPPPHPPPRAHFGTHFNNYFLSYNKQLQNEDPT